MDDKKEKPTRVVAYLLYVTIRGFELADVIR